MNSILTVKDLHKSYAHFALHGISFSLPEGCITGFIGVNGSGKTTTIRSILGLANPLSGSISLFGQQMNSQLKDRLGVVLDEGCFYDNLTMEQMKKVIAPAYSHWSDADFHRYMQQFSLDPRQKIKTLSKGMRMKYALALALSHQAELLIMDEPTSGLDPLIRSQLLELLAQYMEQGGRGVFFSTHITSDLDKIADYLIMIYQGRIVFTEEKDALLDSYRIVKGDASALNQQTRPLFASLQETDFGFTGLTDQLTQVQAHLPDVVVEKPTIEDIMLAHVKGGKQDAMAND